MLIAITRKVSPAIGRCELTHLSREVIDPERADRQHRSYEMLLVEAGCDIVRLPAEPDLPDSVFVEDTAVVLDELAVITRPGAESRRGEISSVAGVLGAHRPLAYIEAPGTLDGGDVLQVNRQLFVGEGHRSNSEGVAQLRRLLREYDYEVTGVPFSGCLHLKSAVTRIADRTILVNPEWVDKARFSHLECVEVHPSEPAAGNGLEIGGRLIYPLAFARTARILRELNIEVCGVDMSEFAKAEGGVSCCSLILPRGSQRARPPEPLMN